jgi:ParB family chromosome partitioning protein
MAELRSVAPRVLQPNPDNPRRTPVPPAMDKQLIASIRAIGIVQPPVVSEKDGALVIKAGHRRVQAAIAAGLPTIDVLVAAPDEAAGLMGSVAENLVRASMNSVDIWRAIDALERQNWNEQAIADALALPVRTVKRLKLLAQLHPPMLDAMAAGSMPSEEQLRTIAAAPQDEQAQVWKKHRPRKGHELSWYEVARALAKRRIPYAAAKFDDALAQAYGVVWEEDLFAPAGEDGRYTANVDGFFGAQQEWLQNNLPERGTLLPSDEYGHVQLPKKAEHVYGKPGEKDLVGHYLDPHSGEVRTVTYRLPEPKKPAGRDKDLGTAPASETIGSVFKTRPEVTQKGKAMIGDFRTDALHQALREAAIEDGTLLALLVLALGADNVSVHSGTEIGFFEREKICATITEGGMLTSDLDLVRTAARIMLAAALSCRDNQSNSGLVARIAGDAIGASLYLPNMATDEFLSCVSRAALEKSAAAEGVRAEARVRDTRAALVERFKAGTWVFPGALFRVTPEELAQQTKRYGFVSAAGWDDPDAGDTPGTEEQANAIADASGADATKARSESGETDDLADAAD